MTNQRLVTWSCPNCDNYHNWIWDKWDIYESEIDMECDKCGKTTQMEMKVSPLTGNADAVPIVKQENKEPKKITLELTLEELKLIDKYVELNDETSEIFDKIRDTYPKSKTLTERTDTWREIFISLTEDEGRYEMGEVNFYHLASHLEELYVRIAELEARLND